MKKAAVTIIFFSQFIKIYLNNKYCYLYLFEILTLQIKKRRCQVKVNETGINIIEKSALIAINKSVLVCNVN